MKIKDQAEEYLNRWDDLQQMNYLKIFLNTYKGDWISPYEVKYTVDQK